MPATEQQRRFTHPVGYGRSVAESDDDRMGRESRHGDAVARQLIRDGQRNPVSCPKSICQIIDRNGEIDPVIDTGFLAEAEARVRIHLARGHFEQAKATIDQLASEWNLFQIANQPTNLAIQERLAWHVSGVFDPRTANLIEELCTGTIGSLLECFPASFTRAPMCGLGTVRKIAETLLRIGVIDAVECQKRIDDWQLAMEQR